MAEFALGGDTGGHSWNNALAHATYEENVEKYGTETARDYLRRDIRSFIQEQKGQDSQWSLSLQGGRMVTETGVSLEEMTANITQGRHARLVPENIKATAPLEAATIREATRLAIEGAEKIILPEQHLDGDGNIVSRYLSVWTKNASDPTRYDGSRIDLGKNVRIEDVRTGTSFTAFEQQDSISFHQHAHQKQAFALAIHSNANNSFTEIKRAMVTKIHRSHQETYSGPFEPILRERQQTQTITQKKYHEGMLAEVSSRVLHDGSETARGVSIYLRNKKIQREIHTEGVVRRDKAIERNSEQTSERLTVARIRERPVRLVELVAKRHGQMRVDTRAIAMITETGIAIHAAPVFLARLAEPLPAPMRAVEKSILRHEKKVRKAPHFAKATRGKREVPFGKTQGKWEVGEARTEGKRNKAKGKKDSLKVQPLRSERVEPLRNEKERKARLKRGLEKGIKNVAAADRLALIASEKRERRVGRSLHRIMRRVERVFESKRMLKREKKLWLALAVAATELASQTFQGKGLSHPRNWEDKKRNGYSDKRREVLTSRPGLEAVRWKVPEEHMVIAEARFAWIVWMMLGRESRMKKNESNSLTVESTFAAVVKPVHPKGEVPTPWVLLSIIYYLTALREQGMINTTNVTNTTNTTKQQIKKSQSVIPEWGIIFVYAS